ncbi:TIGR04388 family protein [Leptospira inadai]|uniref:TIGR04388 family protein n=1 Tax=Leptospira inadai serovar Lyme TaxID=293084 RepID=A0ABX4YE97_9LEPT|nr:TIGR04388 family protein [Leptospira inadai]PNV72623.1 TIGR04388 family protein [Leptospira inadai serovar Lyme]
MKSKLKKRIVLDEGRCPNPKQPGPKGAAILLLLSFLTSSIFSPLLSLNALNTLNAKNDASFQAEAQAAASYATNVQSLAKTMLQGGSFQSWVQGQIQDKVNSAMAQALANATGMSPDMAAQLVSWFEKNQAEKKAKAKARTEEITSGLVTVASIALSFVAGPEMMAVGQAVLQAAQGYQNGGMEGALVGAASGAATAYAREFGVNVGVSYSYSGGFGGTLGLGSSKLNAGVTFSQHGSTSFNVGGSYGNVSYNPQSGFSGSVNLTPGENTGVMVNVAQHSGPSLTVQESNEASGIGGSVTIDGKGNTTVAATYRNATVVSATGNVHDPSSFGNLKGNENFNSDLNQNLAMGKADENLRAGNAELAAGRSKIAETGNEAQREILNNENASAQDQHGVLATLASAGEFLTDPSSASTWLGRTAQDVVGSFLGSTGLGASDSNGFIDKDGNYRQRTCFTAETLIRTTDGLKRIDQIQVGDFVLSINENTGKVSYKRVTQLFVHDVGLIHKVTYENGSTLNTTWNHPFYLRSTGWTEVKDIRLNERSVTIASIRNSEKAKVNSNSGVLLGASLASLNKQTSNQEYSTSWKNEYRGTLGITKVEEVYTNTKVYNFEVEDNHTYFVGKDGVLVHNYLPEFADQINQRVTEIKGAINDPVGTAKAVAENQFSKEGLQRTAVDALTLGQGRNIENLVNATGVNGEEAAARAHANFVFDGVLGVATEGVGKVLSSLRGLSGAAKEVSAGSKATGPAAAEEGGALRTIKATEASRFTGAGDATTSPWLKDTRPGVAEHIGSFRDGGSFLVPESAYKGFIEGKSQIGRSSGQFITTKAEMDRLLLNTGGDTGKINKALGVNWNEPLYRIDVHNPLLHNARLPIGIEGGANSKFRWGGYTSGGKPEVVIDPVKKGQFTANKIQ